MQNPRHTPSKSQLFARQICDIAAIDWNLSIEELNEVVLERLANDALQRFPDLCDSHFRETAIKHILEFQHSFKKLRHGFQLLGEDILGAPFLYKLGVSRRR